MFKRRRPKFLLLAFSFLAVLILLLGACGAPSTQPPSSGAGGSVTKGGTWVDDIFEEPSSLLPNGSSETFADLVDQSIWAPLFYGDTKGVMQPGLATEVPTAANGDISSDLKSWTFKLRPNLKWSDGQPITADDVDFTWKLWNNPGYGAQFSTGFNLIKSADVSADKMSITFHLSQAFVPFATIWLDGLFAPMPKHIFASVSPDSILKSPESLKPSVTSGPFTVSESVLHNHITVVKNPMYYRASEGYPYLDKVVFRVVDNDNTILKDFQANSIDSAFFLDVSKAATYNALPNYHVVTSQVAANFEIVVFNFENPILGKNLDVRKAIAMAIDHNALIKVARRGYAAPLCTDHPPAYHPGYQADAPCPKFDPAAANALLDSDGWVKGADGYRTKGGQKLEFKYSTTANKPWRAADELIIQSNLKDIGIKMNIVNYPASTYFGTILPGGKHDMGEYESNYAVDPDNSSSWACNQVPPKGSNYSFYCNPALDKLFIQEQSTADPAARQQIFNQIHQIELTDFPFVGLYGPPDISVAKKTVHNYLPAPFGSEETANIWTWWCDNAKC